MGTDHFGTTEKLCMSKSLILPALLCGAMLAYSGGATLAAGADATRDQVYQAVRSGHIAEAEQMINQVLLDRPQSSRAHYIAAEVYARAGDYARARAELSTAEQLEPGLPRENPNSVGELRDELSSARVPQAFTVVRPHERGGLPWGFIILVALGLGAVWLIARRRAQMYQGYPGNVPPPVPGQPGYGPGVGPGPYYPGGGGGSGLMGSLGTGLAIGAGVAAGEELVHHVLDGNHPAGGVISSASADELGSAPPPNSDMGGQNFGESDSGSWDDSSGGGFDSGGGGGGDDWT
jgi:hypothetical protein